MPSHLFNAAEEPVSIVRSHVGALPSRPSLLEPDPPFPRHTLPPLIATWLEAHSAAASVPLSLTATPFLACAGGAIGSQLRLEVGPGWYERPVLWVALITLTGIGKTPAIGVARQPFDRLQEETWHHWRDEIAAWSARKPPHPPRPAFDRLLVAGGSIATLAAALQDSTGLVILRDELYGLVRAMDRRGGEDRQHYLSLWSSEPLIPTRPDLAAYLPNPVVGIVGGLQPMLLHKIRRNDQDGFLERFLMVVSAGIYPHPGETSVELPPLDAVVDWLRPLRTIGAASSSPNGVIVRLDPEAHAAWTAWQVENIDHTAVASLPLGGFYRKLPSHVARLALILHALWNPHDPTIPLSGETMKHAIELGAWYRVHIHRSLTLIGKREPLQSAELSLTDRILGLLSRSDEPDGWMGRSRLLVALGRPETSSANDLIDGLVARGIVESRVVRTGGRPATHYRLSQ